MKPSVGRIVHYVLSEQDAAEINRRRTNGPSIADRIKLDTWPIGAQAHIGNEAKVGQVRPMIIVQVWGETEGSCVNGQVFLDGNDVFWATSRNQVPSDISDDQKIGRWFEPPRVS
jgi:hypothetical protein